MARAKVSLQLVGTVFSADTKQPVNNLGDPVLGPYSPVCTISAPRLRTKKTLFLGILEFNAYERLISNTAGQKVASKIAPERELCCDVSCRTNGAIEEGKGRRKAEDA